LAVKKAGNQDDTIMLNSCDMSKFEAIKCFL